MCIAQCVCFSCGCVWLCQHKLEQLRKDIEVEINMWKTQIREAEAWASQKEGFEKFLERQVPTPTLYLYTHTVPHPVALTLAFQCTRPHGFLYLNTCFTAVAQQCLSLKFSLVCGVWCVVCGV